MSIYIINLICIFLCIGISNVFFPKNKKVLVILIFLQLIWLICLRDTVSVGVDMYRYSKTYATLSQSKFIDSFLYNKGSSGLYYLSNFLFSKIGFSFEQFVVIISVFSVGTVGWYIYKYSPKPILSIFIYMGLGTYLFAFSGLRQTVAMAVMLIAIDRYNNGLKYQTVIYITIACLLHTTAIVMIPYFVISKMKITKFIVMAYLLLMSIFIMFRVQLGNLITLIYDVDYLGKYESSVSLGGTAILFILILLLFLLINYGYLRRESEKEIGLLHSLILTVIIQVMSSFAYAFTRVNYYYMQSFIILALPESLEKSKLNKRFKTGASAFEKTVSLLIIIVMLVLYFTSINSDTTLLNYTFFWE